MPKINDCKTHLTPQPNKTCLTTLRRSIAAGLLTFAGTVTATSAGAANITSYTLSGTFYNESIYDAGGNPYIPTSNNVIIDPYDDIVSGTDFTLTFNLDNTTPGAPLGSNGSQFLSAVSNLELTFDSGIYIGWNNYGMNDDVLAFNNAGSNDQWSIFSTPYNSTDIDYLSVYDIDNSDYPELLTLDFLELSLLDMDEALYSTSPPELIAFNGTEFEVAELNLTWLGDNGVYDYAVFGEVTSITVSAVPLPGALWLFGSGLLAFVGISARARKTS